jgi:hypothetical protein
MRTVFNRNKMEVTIGEVRLGVNYTNGVFWYPVIYTGDYDFDFVTQKTYNVRELFFLNYHFYFGKESGRFSNGA